jgi:hypothetical protein
VIGDNDCFLGEIILACPPVRRSTIEDPRSPRVMPPKVYGRRTTKVDFVDGVLLIHCFNNDPPMGGELRKLWKDAEEKAHVTRITLMLESTMSSSVEVWHWLGRNGFYRDICSESPRDPSIAFTKDFPAAKA